MKKRIVLSAVIVLVTTLDVVWAEAAACKGEPEPALLQPVPDLTAKSRPELKALFEECVFGVRPVEKPPVERFEQISPDEDVFDGLGFRRRMKMIFGNGEGKTAKARR